ncbi:methylated-DNA--[protein]-cysteine S-methyltransferase [Metabacillus hrfriensis]|uniref:Methylated-DNA--[protein]-cysteine S-methyltransferase n=1 Tax=Metabacillus hrfriensis TaxID=3048891 RepID=A0ACD4RG27_9BACI|nr:methylated-DNA--[protein]-cysteine S-methyltransferase [Metabacillus sp. CT-WN-B3]WHZ59437.1 methylated-DNA--[protein]-cysteine S-methyltransferase [Metabacillus sp. CT-WN-B3]
MHSYTAVHTPIGKVIISADDHFITRLFLSEEQFEDYVQNHPMRKADDDHLLLKDAIKQLTEYFEGKRTSFQLPFKQTGTAFQEHVWSALEEIPYGESRTYLDIAVRIGKPKAVRAVGQANKKNSLPIFIPCHRVIGAKGMLTGYAGTQTDLKAVLLDLEKISYQA